MRVQSPLVVLASLATLLSAGSSAQSPERFGRLAALLDAGQVVFGSFVGDKSASGAAQLVRQEDADWYLYDMEHSPLDISELRTFLQFTLDPADIIEHGAPARHHPVLVRIPANGREMNQWMIKNILDQGASGIVVPHVETAEQALGIVKSMRYPRKPGSPDYEPEGQRGSGAGNASRLWGVSGREYRRLAGLWPLDEGGEMVNLLLIENPRGVEHVRDIVQVKGVSMISAAPGDLSSAYEGDREAVERAIQTILAAAKEFNVPCAITAGPDDVERRVREGFRVIITSGEALRIGRQAAGRQ